MFDVSEGGCTAGLKPGHSPWDAPNLPCVHKCLLSTAPLDYVNVVIYSWLKQIYNISRKDIGALSPSDFRHLVSDVLGHGWLDLVVSLSVLLLQRSSLNWWQTTLAGYIDLKVLFYAFSSMKAIEPEKAPNCICRMSAVCFGFWWGIFLPRDSAVPRRTCTVRALLP